MAVLLLNAGSSSLKYQLMNMVDEKVLIKGICEKIGSNGAIIKSETFDGRVLNKKLPHVNSHKDAFYYIKDLITDRSYGVLNDIWDISAIGHRVVHGGEYFKGAKLIDNDVITKIKHLVSLAPLHNQVNLNVIMICREIFKNKIPQIAVFDTSFYSEMQPKAYMMGIPYEYYKKYNIRKYGFHGTSHKYVSEECAKMMGKNIKDLKIITCHLGNGASITAIKDGRAVDTSMGLTPLGGIMMGTRCGSLDPSVVTFIQEKENLNFSEVNNILNKRSGLLGISGVSNDDRDILNAIENGNERAILSHEMMDYQIIKYIGAYIAAMNGCDAIVFTAGIGENQWVHRETICSSLSFIGVEIDKDLNRRAILGKQGKISSSRSKISVYVIKTNEELVMLREVSNFLNKNRED